MGKLPEVQAVDRYQESLDDISISSDISSLVNGGRGKDRYPFVPYRIDDHNMAKMDALFEQGYHHELAAALPNSMVLSRFGFSDYDPKQLAEDSSESDHSDDDMSTLSSGTRSASIASYSSYAGTGTNLSRDTSKADLTGSRMPTNRTMGTGTKQSKKPLVQALANQATVRNKVAKQFNIHAPYRPDDLLQLVDDNSFHTSTSVSSNNASRSSHGQRLATAPHRLVQQLRSPRSTHSKGPQRAQTSGLFMADAIVSNDNWNSMSPGRVRTARPVSTAFMSQSISSGPTDLQAYLTELDPLSLSIMEYSSPAKGKSIVQEVFTEEMQWDDMLDSDDEGHPKSVHDRIVEEEEVGNEYVRTRKLRMKAEKLIDHSFVQKFFVHKKPNVAAIQEMLLRIEQLFEIIDTDHSGYITFEAFTRLLMAVAPKQIVRQDITTFINAQTDNMADLVDYNEFIISGKVLLLTKAQALVAKNTASKSRLFTSSAQQAANALPHADDQQLSSTKTWLARQKAVTGEASTYTWKNHVEWYQKRKASALIWCIRRATRALDHEILLKNAKSFLLVQAKQAHAMTFLLEIGRVSLLQKDKSNVARQKLLRRVMHARYFILKVQHTHEYLKNIADSKKRELDFLDRIHSMKRTIQQEEIREQVLLLSRPKQADYANLYKVKVLQERSRAYLHALAKRSIVHSNKQAEVMSYLIAYATKVQGQLIIKDRARRELIQRAEVAYEFLIKQDQILLGLLRIGQTALKFMDRQTDALNFLLAKGPAAIEFLSAQASAQVELYAMGRKTLSFMNTREDAFAYLRRRREKSALFIEKKREAVAFLRSKPDKIWGVLTHTDDAQEWLVQRAQRAARYIVVRNKAQQYLQYVAGKANATSRRIAVAYEELTQLGLIAKFEWFKMWSMKMPKVCKNIATEVTQIKKLDAENHSLRKNMNPVIRNKIELRQAFEILCTICTPKHILNSKSTIQKLEDLISDEAISTLLSATLGSSYHPKSTSMTPSPTKTMRSTAGTVMGATGDAADTPLTYMLGRFGIRRLLQNGKILQVDLTAVDEFFRSADIRNCGYISFNDMLPWWREHSDSVLHNKTAYTIAHILSPLERAQIIVYKRVMREMKEEEDEENEYLKFKNRKQSNLDEVDEEEEDSDDDSDEDSELDSDAEETLMSDVNKLKDVDVGKLMKYLTRRRRAVDMTPHPTAPSGAAGSVGGDIMDGQSVLTSSVDDGSVADEPKDGREEEMQKPPSNDDAPAVKSV